MEKMAGRKVNFSEHELHTSIDTVGQNRELLFGKVKP